MEHLVKTLANVLWLHCATWVQTKLSWGSAVQKCSEYLHWRGVLEHLIKSLYLNLIFQVLTRNQTQPTRKGCGKNAYACRIVFKNDILTYRSCLCMDTKRSAAYTASFVELATMCLGILSHCSGCMSKSSVANNLPCLASSSHSQKIRLP